MNDNRRLPLYIQIRDHLRDRIEMGEILPGMSIPSEAELADFYGVSRLTVRSALHELEAEGVLYSVQGKGSYVKGTRIERDLDQLSGFTRAMREKHLHPKNSIVNFQVREAGELYAEIFQIQPNDLIHAIKRASHANGIPVALEFIYIPASIIPHLVDVNVTDFSLYDIYDFYGIKVTHAEQSLEIVRLEKHEARLLDISTDQAVFRFESTTYSDTKPIEHAITYVRNDLCTYQVNFSN